MIRNGFFCFLSLFVSLFIYEDLHLFIYEENFFVDLFVYMATVLVDFFAYLVCIILY